MNLLSRVTAALHQKRTNRSSKRRLRGAGPMSHRRALVESLELRCMLSADTVGLYDPASHSFFLNNLLDGSTSNVQHETIGVSEVPTYWRPITGDWDGDGIDTIGVFNQLGLTFYLDNDPGNTNQTIEGPQETVFTFTLEFNSIWCRGIPLAGDWDGDGDDGLAIYDRRFHTFYFFNDLNNHHNIVTYQTPEVPASWIPIAGDWNGDGADSAGLYDPNTSTYYLRNSPTSEPIVIDAPFVPCRGVLFPVAGDFNNDGVDTVGIYDRNGNFFHLSNTHNGWGDVVHVQAPDVPSSWYPVAGNWDGIEAGGGAGESASIEFDYSEPLDDTFSITEYDFPDIDGNQEVTPLDVLSVINYLNSNSSEVDTRFDTNQDGQVTSLDALIVINYINDATLSLDNPIAPFADLNSGSPSDPSDSDPIDETEDLTVLLDDVIEVIAGDDGTSDDVKTDPTTSSDWDLNPILPDATEDVLEDLFS